MDQSSRGLFQSNQEQVRKSGSGIGSPAGGGPMDSFPVARLTVHLPVKFLLPLIEHVIRLMRACKLRVMSTEKLIENKRNLIR